MTSQLIFENLLYHSSSQTLTEYLSICHFVSADVVCTCMVFLIQIIHSRVVDTAIVFPHRMGLPYKRALRTITAEFLHMQDHSR